MAIIDYIIKQLYHSLSSYMADSRLGAIRTSSAISSYTTRAHGIIVKYSVGYIGCKVRSASTKLETGLTISLKINSAETAAIEKKSVQENILLSCSEKIHNEKQINFLYTNT